MNYYAQAIKIIDETSESQKARIFMEIAKFNPKAVCDAFDRMNDVNEIKKDCKVIYEGQGFIQAIKHLRIVTNCGLKEGKDQIEKWAQEGNWNRQGIDLNA